MVGVQNVHLFERLLVSGGCWCSYRAGIARIYPGKRRTAMLTIHKKVLLDESMNPVAVQIDYADWVDIAQRLGIESKSGESTALQRFEGAISLTEDPMAFQTRMRKEWQ